MLIFQTFKSDNLIVRDHTAIKVNLEDTRHKGINRTVSARFGSVPTMESAYEKLWMAKEMRSWRAGAVEQELKTRVWLVPLDTDKLTAQERQKVDDQRRAMVLQKLGYAGKIEDVRSMQSDAFDVAYNKAVIEISRISEDIGKIRKILDATADPAMARALRAVIDERIKAANVAASVVLKMEEKYILWASKAAAKEGRFEQEVGGTTFKDILHQLVDANAYLAQTNMTGLYNLQKPINGQLGYVVNSKNDKLELYFGYINLSEKYFSDTQANGGWAKLVDDYSRNIAEFDTRFSKEVDNATSDFEYAKRIREANGPLMKTYEAWRPYVDAATPVAAALSLMSPYTAAFGIYYFTKSATDSILRGEYLQGGLTLLVMAGGPVSEEMGSFSMRILQGTGKVVGGAAKATGLYFMVDMGFNSGALIIDATKYGLTVEQMQELGTDMGFMIMPAASQKVKTGLRGKRLSEVLPEKIEPGEAGTGGKTDANQGLADVVPKKTGKVRPGKIKTADRGSRRRLRDRGKSDASRRKIVVKRSEPVVSFEQAQVSVETKSRWYRSITYPDLGRLNSMLFPMDMDQLSNKSVYVRAKTASGQYVINMDVREGGLYISRPDGLVVQRDGKRIDVEAGKAIRLQDRDIVSFRLPDAQIELMVNDGKNLVFDVKVMKDSAGQKSSISKNENPKTQSSGQNLPANERKTALIDFMIQNGLYNIVSAKKLKEYIAKNIEQRKDLTYIKKEITEDFSSRDWEGWNEGREINNNSVNRLNREISQIIDKAVEANDWATIEGLMKEGLIEPKKLIPWNERPELKLKAIRWLVEKLEKEGKSVKDISSIDFKNNGLSGLSGIYSSSPYLALADAGYIYSESQIKEMLKMGNLEMDGKKHYPWEMKITPNIFNDKEMRIASTKWLVQKLGKDVREFSVDDFGNNGLYGPLSHYYSSSPYKTLADAGYFYSESQIKEMLKTGNLVMDGKKHYPWEMKLTRNIFNDKELRIATTKWLVLKLGKNAVDITYQDFRNNGLKDFIETYYSSSPYLALADAGYFYSESQIKEMLKTENLEMDGKKYYPWEMNTPPHIFSDKEMRIASTKWLVQKLGKDVREISAQDFIDNGSSGLYHYYSRSIYNALVAAGYFYSETQIKEMMKTGNLVIDENKYYPWEMKITPNIFNDKEMRIASTKWLVQKLGKDVCEISAKDFENNGLIGVFLVYYSSSPYKALTEADYFYSETEIAEMTNSNQLQLGDNRKYYPWEMRGGAHITYNDPSVIAKAKELFYSSVGPASDPKSEQNSGASGVVIINELKAGSIELEVKSSTGLAPIDEKLGKIELSPVGGLPQYINNSNFVTRVRHTDGTEITVKRGSASVELHAGDEITFSTREENFEKCQKSYFVSFDGSRVVAYGY